MPPEIGKNMLFFKGNPVIYKKTPQKVLIFQTPDFNFEYDNSKNKVFDF